MPSPEVLESLQKLQDELNKLEPAIKHVETAVEISNTVRTIPEKHLELLESIKKADKKFKDELSEVFREKVNDIEEVNKVTLDQVRSLAEVISQYHTKLTELRDQIEVYFEWIKSINFPDRLDKIDNSINAINIGIQNIQTRLSDVERQLISKVENLEKRQKTGNIINIILSIIIILSLFLMIYRSF